MRKRLLAKLVIIVALGVISSAHSVPASQPQPMKTHQYRCTDRNQSLYIIIYENNGQLNGGNMYLENIQVANLTAVTLQLFSDRILVANYTASTRVEVCKSTHKYQ
ncbi:MAG: hypothetical protein AUG51_05365 [Acidobacteria bacterium 13_1_20CM_3_53_8]|nr:MAG: hypothetical protein AUG51_05365 [Acidobacteria bacterium 13_1_20CM_3_53_8]